MTQWLMEPVGERQVIFVLTFLAFALIVAAMSVGVMAGREPIKGPVAVLEHWALISPARFVVVIHSVVKPKHALIAQNLELSNSILLNADVLPLGTHNREATEFQ